MALPRILLIDDHPVRSRQFTTVMEFLEYRVTGAATVDEPGLFDDLADVIAVFVGYGSERQAAILKTAAEKVRDRPVILLLDRDAGLHISTAIRQMVFEVLPWPAIYTEVFTLFQNIKALPGVNGDRRRPGFDRRRTDRREGGVLRLVGNSRAIERTRRLIDQVADSDATVLILGESGTGKEVIARCLHRISPRRDKPFVPINCGAIPGELLESELFGHDKGAFTGALTNRQGRFELANGGTLFLDEIGDMPMAMQVKLLRVLQERTFERVGSNKTIHCDIRVMAATHRNLEKEIKENRFREDLFYRLNVFPIDVPSLRERAEDIPLLVKDLIKKMEAGNRGSVCLTESALRVLMQYPWPGNIRELANLIERLAILHPDGTVDAQALPEKFHQYGVYDARAANQDVTLPEPQEVTSAIRELTETIHIEQPLPSAQLPEQGLDLKEYLSDMESDLISQALDECNGVVAHAAKRLNMRRTTLVEKLRKYDLHR